MPAPSFAPRRSVIARLVRSADFERVLRTRSRASSAHFALHHVPEAPSVPAKAAKESFSAKLSTGESLNVITSVDDSAPSAPFSPPVGPDEVWLGAVVPKRHAKRSVTRTLLKRQIRAAVGDHAASLARGLWVVRLRAPFDRKHFVSAASDELKRVARTELRQLLAHAVRGAGVR